MLICVSFSFISVGVVVKSVDTVDRYDVAVLKLSRSVSYRDNILPICLPPQGKDYEGALGVVAGWGKTDTSFGEPTRP